MGVGEESVLENPRGNPVYGRVSHLGFSPAFFACNHPCCPRAIYLQEVEVDPHSHMVR